MITLSRLALLVALAGCAFSQDYKLPDPLRLSNGSEVTGKEWRAHRRREILDLFREHVYGRSPQQPTDLRFNLVAQEEQALGGKVTRREVDIKIGGEHRQFTFRLTVYLPNKAPKPTPVFLLLNHRNTVASQIDRPFFPVTEIVARGYAAAGITLGQLSPDDVKTYRNGVIDFYDGAQERSPDSWRTIAAWAWAGQRAMDYFETDKDIDARRVAVIGHSRGGKAALWCGAQDERFALTIGNESGETGAALARRRKGELVVDINKKFPHWFNQNYKKYNDREDTLPVDQHELIALLAPRLVYVASAEGDSWSDPPGEFLSCFYATPVFHVLGVRGMETARQPSVEQSIQSGQIGYHMRKGGHDLTEYDWQQFMNFADQHLRRAGTQSGDDAPIAR